MRRRVHSELLSAIDKYDPGLWAYRRLGVQALLAEGKRAEALRFAEASDSRSGDALEIARICEQILLDSGLAALRRMLAE